MSEVVPPSMTMVCPVIKPASSEHRNTAILGMSRAIPKRATALLFCASSGASSGSSRDRGGISIDRNPAGSDGVHPDAAITKLDRQGTCAGDDRAFGGCIGGVLRRPLAVDRGQIADRAVPCSPLVRKAAGLAETVCGN